MTSPGTPTVDATLEAPVSRPMPSATRSTALLLGASAVAIVANYAFLLAAGRILGAEDYGALAALLGLLAIVLLPASALQMAIARELSRLIAQDARAEAEGFAHAMLRLALIATAPLVLLALALAAPLAELLNIDSTGIVALATLTFATALVYPVAMGILQGRQRFRALAALYVLPWLLRLALLGALVAAGFRLGGAVLATTAAAVAGTLVAVLLVRRSLRRPAVSQRIDVRSFLRYLVPVVVGLVGIALLTHVDILIVKARFVGDLPGAYGAASAFARVAFFVPTTLLIVLFPRTAARQARGEATEDILGRSLIATGLFCGALALFYAAAGVGLVVTTFGVEFAEGGEVLAPFALAIGLYSLANILVGYHLSRGEARYAWIVAAGVVAQMAVLALVPTNLEAVVWANVAVAGCLVAAHELAVGSSVPALRAGARQLPVAWARVRAVLAEAALVLLGTTAFVCLLFWRVVGHLGSTIVGNPGSDSTASVAWFWQARHETGYHILGSTHHTLSGAPFGWDETNGLNIQGMLVYYPTYLAAKVLGDVAAYNLAVLSGYVLSGAAMYLLVRYLGCRPLVASWAALAAIVFPWHLARAEHGSLTHVEGLILLLLALVAAAQRPSWQRYALVGAATLACWLTSGYFGAMAIVVTAAFSIGGALIVGRQRAPHLVAGVIGSSLAATALVVIAAGASGVGSGAGLDRVAGDLSVYGLRPLELVVPPRQSLVFGDWLTAFWDRHDHGSNPTETANYLGLLTIGLALAWLVLVLRRRGRVSERRRVATVGLAVTFVVGAIFAAPSPIVIFGHEVWTGSRLLWEVISAFRVPSRWDPLLMAAIVPLAALGLQAVYDRLRRGRGRSALAVTAIAAAMALSFTELSISAVPHYRTVPVPPEYAAVSSTPRGILAEYPLGYSDIYRFRQREHGRPLVNGAPKGTVADEARLVLLDPAQQGTASALALLGVTAIGIHPGAHVDTEVNPREPSGEPGYRLVGRFPGASVWEVVAQPAPALVIPSTGGFGLPERQPDGVVGYPLVSSSGVGSLDLRAREGGVVRLTFDAEPPGGEPRVLRIADAEGEQSFTLDGKSPVSLLVEIPRGHSQLLVKTDPPPASPEEAIVLSAPRTVRASGAPALHASLVSADPGF